MELEFRYFKLLTDFKRIRPFTPDLLRPLVLCYTTRVRFKYGLHRSRRNTNLFRFIISSSAIAAHADAGSQKQAVAMCCYGKFLSRPQRAQQALSSA